ncbi:magnesium-dependent phosphatase 1,putative [Basidiobolus meristosporus CBS 931.73]|uniref:Magnesium-dependent phosphatase 1,putative n=1 Tax=Basidiobolus meristosporus CBS 931.73 TaxID=1314790 RepID=A0A1Y1Z6L7_9FUNG|nr:magnesium-dependent phosphatase 1,putative [Basidiobolus meristosporus CBS 931.73]|eukprot:ORY05445.1 magnesium-dependent phosphatase 1,putative [Basidiobolus meristosporus CBS 931.73]
MEIPTENLLPKIIVFDLDYTLWPLWLDTHLDGPPFEASGTGVKDCSGNVVEFYPDVPVVLEICRRLSNTILAVASRTHEPRWANQIISRMKVRLDKEQLSKVNTLAPASSPGDLLFQEYIDHEEIYPGSKLKHFKSISKKYNIGFEEMVFFDDEFRNIKEISKLGVKCVYVQEGVTLKNFLQALNEFAQEKTLRL